MFKKLDNNTWEKYICAYEKIENQISIAKYCNEKNLNKSNFMYHRRRLRKIKQPVLQSITVKKTEEFISTINKEDSNITITFKNASISIPTGETDLILSMMKELILNAEYR